MSIALRAFAESCQDGQWPADFEYSSALTGLRTICDGWISCPSGWPRGTEFTGDKDCQRSHCGSIAETILSAELIDRLKPLKCR